MRGECVISGELPRIEWGCEVVANFTKIYSVDLMCSKSYGDFTFTNCDKYGLLFVSRIQ